MSKRRKGFRGNTIRTASRPIDKKLICVVQTLSSAADTTTTLVTTTFAATIVGIRWDINIKGNLSTGDSQNYWALVVVRDGLSASAMAVGNGNEFYTPEQDVLAFGNTQVTDMDATTGPRSIQYSGSTKSMRKLQGGDTVQLIGGSGSVNAATLVGTIQFFLKS